VADKAQIIEQLEMIGRLLELQGENPFKIRAYSNAVRVLETAPLAAPDLENAEKLADLPGIGKALAEKIAVLASTGKLPYLEELRAKFPPGIFALFELQGLGAKKIKVLHDELKISSIKDLAAACEDGRVAALPGFGEKTATNLRKAIEQRAKNSGRFRVGEVAAMAESLLDGLRQHPDVTLAQIAGSFRRRKEIVGDLDFIVATKAADEVSEWFTSHPLVAEVLARGATKSSVILQTGIQCDLRTVSMAEFPFALAYFTGSKEHNVRLRGLCLDKGWTLNEYRFAPAADRELLAPIPEVREESDIYQALGLEFVPPELRENLGEFEAAAEGKLPDLLELENLRGTFHNHTTASDGQNTLAEMAEAAIELGLEYLGIADHSKSSFQAHGLDAERLLAQREEIAALNQTLQGSLTVFSGTECDILKDGTLDFPDEILAQLDYVVASVHSSFNLDEATMTKRLIRAMENPYVTMLGHLTGRLLLARDSYAVDIPAVLEAAAATQTVIELNASPWRLELDWRWWPLAKEKGVLCSINPDAHSVNGLQDLYFGVGIARKGWLTRRDVINCLRLPEIKKFLRRKK
jgi:DNA polymerase (family 10)